MRLTLLSDDAIRIDVASGPMTIEAATSAHGLSPFHMLGGGLGYCTLSVLHAWAMHASLTADDLAVEVRWTFAEDPHRVGALRVSLDWPSLPRNRVVAAKRVAEMCTIHATLTHAPAITIESAA